MKEKNASRGKLILRVKKSFKYQAILALLFAVLFIFPNFSYATECPKIIISELQITGGTGKTNEDFIELLNAGDENCNLEGHRIVKRTENGTSDNLIYEWQHDEIVLPWRYYLWANAGGFATKINADVSSNGLISSDNGIALRYRDDNGDKIIDALGWGASKNIYSQEYLFEKNPGTNQSLERNADGTFFLQTKPEPKNSLFEKDEEKNVCKADILFNEIYPFTNEEYVEVVNQTDSPCFLTGWKISDEKGYDEEFPDDAEIAAGDFFILDGNLHLNNDTDKVYLFNSRGERTDEREYEVDFSTQDKSYSFFENDWRWTKSLTPAEENVENYEEDEEDSVRLDERSEHAGTVFINEFLPDPEKGDDEFIEIYNSGDAERDLSGWKIHDATKSGEYEFESHVVIGAKKFLTIFGEVFKFALNSSKETLTLRDEEGKIVSEIYYDKSKKGASYNFNGSIWRWSKFLTPGKENIFNSEPYGKIKIPDEIYEKVYAEFSVGTGDTDGDIVKVTWDFGDKHKSYLAKTRHKYVKKGTYEGYVKLSDGSEDVVHNFTVKVEEFPHPKVKITIVNANPKGSDTKFETITIQNKSKKKINLNGWSIATGWKNLVNHPIREDVEIKKNKSKELSREVSSFTLNNKKDKIELRYPDGEVAYKLKYKKEEGIEEGEVYRKVDGGWEWKNNRQNSTDKILKKNMEELIIDNQDAISNIQKTGISKQPDFKQEKELVDSSNQSSDKEEKGNKLITLSNEKITIEILKFDAAIIENTSVRNVEGKYLLTGEISSREHYGIVFLKKVSSNANLKLNFILNYFLN